jgi:hypothetical protein
VIENATVSAITAPNPATAGGDVTFPAPTPISVRAVLDEPTTAQRIALGQVIADATAVLFVLKSQLGNLKVARGYEVRVRVDGGDPQILVVTHVVERVKDGGLSHYQAFLKERAG